MKNRMLRKAMVVMVMAMVTGVGMGLVSTARAEFEVYDAKNQYLGVLATDIADGYHYRSLDLFLPSMNQVVRVLGDGNVEDNRIFRDFRQGNVILSYETEDCTGKPYLDFPPTILLSGLFNYPSPWYCIIQGHKFSLGKPKTFAPKSWKAFGSTECRAEPQPTEERPMFPLTEVDTIPPIQLPFTTPVALPLQFKQTTFDVNGDRRRGLAEGIFILQDTAGAR